MALLSRTPSIAVFYRTSGWLRFCPKDAHRFTTDALSRRASTIHATPLVSETSQKLILQEINVSDSFQKSRLRKEVASALQEAGITSLTEIQTKAIPAIRNSNDVLIASHTGSGKTYAYLIPIVERLKSQEEMEDSLPLRVKRPRAVVLGPTRELTNQILQVAKSLSHHVRFCSTVLNAGIRMRTQRSNLAAHQDLVVATPTKLIENHRAGNIFLRDVQVLVLDEADTLFDECFLPETEQILSMLKKRRERCQFVLVAATVTKKVKSMMRKYFPDLEMIETTTLHKSVSGSIHSFAILKPGQDKICLLRDVLAPDVKNLSKVMVFCNTLSSCRAIEHNLQEHNIASISYHGQIPIKERRDIIEKFSGIDDEGHVLVCTDLAARGLDIPGRVDHVINFDFPMTPIDYLHRSGRTARAGASGKITSLVTGKDRVLADRIKWAIDHDLTLDELSSRKSVLPPSLKPKPNSSEEKGGRSLKGLRGAKRVEVLDDISKKMAKQKRELERKKGIHQKKRITNSKEKGKR